MGSFNFVKELAIEDTQVYMKILEEDKGSLASV